MDILRPISLNNRLIVETYKKEGLKTVEKNGFAFVSQKLFLKGLKVLIDGCLSNGAHGEWLVKRGSTVYIKEETLHTQAWAQKPMECSYIEEPFLIVDLNHIEFVTPPKE